MKFMLLGGFAESLLNFRGPLIDALLVRGLEVHVAAPGLSPGSEVHDALVARGVIPHDVPLRRTGMNPLADVGAGWHLWRLMRCVQPDCFLGYTIKPVIYGSMAAWLAGVPQRYALITGLGYAFQEGTVGLKGALVRRVARELYAAALRVTHKVFFQNPDDEALFRSLGILPSGRASVVVNGSGVDIHHFAVAPLPSGLPKFLMIARLLGAKGVREYALAAAQVRAVHPGVSCALAGWIDDGPAAIAQSELDAWVVSGTLDYLGRLSDVRPALAACSVYILPSYREGTPRTVLEAMSMGRPVITTDTPGCRETVREGRNGFLVAVRSADMLAAAMLRFVNDPGLTGQMGTESRTMVEDRYDVHKVNRMMLAEMGLDAR